MSSAPVSCVCVSPARSRTLDESRDPVFDACRYTVNGFCSDPR